MFIDCVGACGPVSLSWARDEARDGVFWVCGAANKAGGVSAISTSLPGLDVVRSGKEDLLRLAFSRTPTSFILCGC